MALTSEVKRYLLEYLACQQLSISEQVCSGIRSNGEISSAERLTDQELIDHFPQLFADLIEYFLTGAKPETRRRTIEAALQHGLTRWKQGYQLVELIRELGIVQSSIFEHGIELFFREKPQWDGQVHDARKNLAAFFEDTVAGSVQRYVENFTDELRNANAKLLQANENLSRADKARLRLIQTVSHEIANVLNALRFTITLATTGSDAASRSEIISVCQRNVQEMSELLNDLKDYSALIAGATSLQIEEINLSLFASEFEASFRAIMQAAGVRLLLRTDPLLDRIRSDRKKLRQIITNLVTNALNYRDRDKTNEVIILEFRSSDQDAWQIVVEDSGIGIPAEHLDSIFDEFARVSPSEEIKGAGLGLAITKRLVEELRGTVQVFSEVGQGSRFVVTIPGMRF